MATIRKFRSKTKGIGYKVDYYDTDGAHRRKTLYTDRETAEAFANKLEFRKYQVRNGLADDLKPNITFREAIERYLDIAWIQKKANTIEREMYIYKRLQKYMGDLKIRAITPDVLEGYIRMRHSKDKVRPATIRIEVKTLRQFFNVLINHKYLMKNPAKGVNGPKVLDKPIRFLTIEEEQDLLNVIDSANFKDLIVSYLHSGARKSELLPDLFDWTNVDFEKRTITLSGKRDKIRTIPMTNKLYEILHRRKHKMNAEVPFEFRYQNVGKRLGIYYKIAGIKNADVHTLRRTYGSRMVQRGVPVFAVSKLLGHSTVTITEKHYVDLLGSDLAQHVSVLDDE